MASFEPVRAILRGLDILSIINEVGPVVATEIARRSSLPQPTIIRILETLISAGYVYREPHSAAYGVTARTLALSRGFNTTSRLVQLATPLIENLRAEIGWPSNLAVFERDGMTIAYTNRGAHGMSIPGRLGARIPVLATATGVAYLASLSDLEVEDMLRRLSASDSRWDSSPEVRARFPERLAFARQEGYAFADQAYLDEIYHSRLWAVAVPIVVDGRTVAGLSSLVLDGAGSRKRVLGQILSPLRRAVATIAELLLQDAGLTGDPGASPVKGSAQPRRRNART
jgi:IclR family mhp operon transcriptional activator